MNVSGNIPEAETELPLGNRAEEPNLSTGNIAADADVTGGSGPAENVVSVLTSSPEISLNLPRPGTGENGQNIGGSIVGILSEKPAAGTGERGPKNGGSAAAAGFLVPNPLASGSKDFYLSELREQLTAVIASSPSTRASPIMEDKAEDAKVAPAIWISCWVDYSDKYGFGYALCDASIGVVFNDLTKMLVLKDGPWVSVF